MDRDCIVVGIDSIEARILSLCFEEKDCFEIILVYGSSSEGEMPSPSDVPACDLEKNLRLNYCLKIIRNAPFIFSLQRRIVCIYIGEGSCCLNLLPCGDLQIKQFPEFMSGVPP
ncbi:MAG: hypothetical protein PHX25_00695 [Candidatus Pacebacteria bacterium]|nr:hypothetical protein [Candidatus Paceibacterota bacterium]